MHPEKKRKKRFETNQTKRNNSASFSKEKSKKYSLDELSYAEWTLVNNVPTIRFAKVTSSLSTSTRSSTSRRSNSNKKAFTIEYIHDSKTKEISLQDQQMGEDCFDKCNQLLYCFVEKLSDCPIEKLQNKTNPLAQMSMERRETLGKRVAKYYIEDKKLRLGTVVSVDEDDSRRWDKIQYMIRWDDTTYSSLTQNEVCISIDDFRNQTKRFVFKRNKQAKIPKDGIFHNVTLKDPPVKKI